MPHTGVRIIRFKGIDVFLHWSWFLIFGILYWAVLQFLQLNAEIAGLTAGATALVTTCLFFVSVLLHELAHSVVANRNGVPIKRITLFVFGGMAQMESDVTTPQVELRMAIAGPACSYLLGLTFGALAVAASRAGSDTPATAATMLAVVNLGMGTFNLIPGFPLDGGRVLRSALWHRTGDLAQATRMASRLGESIGGAMATGGVILLAAGVFSEGHTPMLGGVWFLLIGCFLVWAAASSYRQARIRAILEPLRVGELMRAPQAVDGVTTLEEVAHIYLRTQQPVAVLRKGKLAGMLEPRMIRRLAPARWPVTPVEQVSRRIDVAQTTGPEESLANAFWRMNRRELALLWVIEDGRLMGMLMREDLRQLIRRRLREASGREPGNVAS
ncbi:MAG: site-2 protease family protein [Candidatus Geothermincolia bacterium]